MDVVGEMTKDTVGAEGAAGVGEGRDLKLSRGRGRRKMGWEGWGTARHLLHQLPSWGC